jgi:hypothetical protein
MEVRYLQYLIQKHAKDDCDTSILIKKWMDYVVFTSFFYF